MVRWKYKESNVLVKMDEMEKTFSCLLRFNNTLNIKVDMVKVLEGKLGIPISSNIELVVQIVGIRKPPSVWCKVI